MAIPSVAQAALLPKVHTGDAAFDQEANANAERLYWARRGKRNGGASAGGCVSAAPPLSPVVDVETAHPPPLVEGAGPNLTVAQLLTTDSGRRRASAGSYSARSGASGSERRLSEPSLHLGPPSPSRSRRQRQQRSLDGHRSRKQQQRYGASQSTPTLAGGHDEIVHRPVKGKLVDSTHANYILMYHMLTGIRIGVSLIFQPIAEGTAPINAVCFFLA